MPLFQDGNMREDWNFKVEESDIEVPQQFKEEPEDDYWLESHTEQQSSPITNFEVRQKHFKQ